MWSCSLPLCTAKKAPPALAAPALARAQALETSRPLAKAEEAIKVVVTKAVETKVFKFMSLSFY